MAVTPKARVQTNTKYRPSAGELADQKRPTSNRPAGSKSVLDSVPGMMKHDVGPGYQMYSYRAPKPTINTDIPKPRPPGGNPYGSSGGGRGGGGGGGGGGGTKVDMNTIMALLGKRPQQQTWQNLDVPDYQAQAFYNFDTGQYDKARTGLAQGIAADSATGNQAYADATTELQQYQNPFAGRSYTQNQPMDEAMQRMMQANGVQGDQATQNQGVQADQAFGNVLALLGGAAQNSQASSLRAVAGDQRRFTESLQNQGRNLGLGIDMAQARAKDQYEKDKFAYGEEVARFNYQQNMQEAQYNNQGQNQANAANVTGNNQYNASSIQALIQLISGGQNIDAAQLQQYLSTLA